MTYLYGFLFCGGCALAGQLIYDHTRLTPGHITSLFVVIGSLLECLNIYDFLISVCGIGATMPILSFGHSLTHASLSAAQNDGWIGILTGVFDKTASGISFAIFMAFWVAIFFKARD
ncbi:SpoVA/SpoVAEb family sporulation membrane protein [Traorella massiliensis]|uniref:SpoVA/SpoVAEb family sporulation membrane protein n=1 Tax=Traorella massiliensis TaxID=1903263 RepID=UPI0008F8DC6E|nr:SpoVA/SpoVAEb family sporulation membrane protein [Traorella massiliensis]